MAQMCKQTRNFVQRWRIALRAFLLACSMVAVAAPSSAAVKHPGTGPSKKVGVTKGKKHSARPTVQRIAKTATRRPGARLSRAVPTPEKPQTLQAVHTHMLPAAPAYRVGDDGLPSLRSTVAYVVDQDTQEVLLSKNDQAVLPIASLTKLMTGLIIVESNLPMDEPITITQDDVDTEKGSSSRLRVGSTLSRGELLHLALMSSENRAAHALGRTHPLGLEHFVRMMNSKAKELGMKDTRYVEPTGLSSQNRSSARDLARLVDVASHNPVLSELSTSPGHQVAVGNRILQYNNTNRLVKNPTWEIGLQKTGYIAEAGQCLVMQTRIAGRKLIMVFLDSAGKLSRLGDAERVRRWVTTSHQVGANTNAAGQRRA